MRKSILNPKRGCLPILMALVLGLVFAPPINPVKAQDDGPLPPHPPRLEPYPAERNVQAMGIPSHISAPEASSISYNTLPTGDDAIHGMVYYNNYLYASTRSIYPAAGRILKVNPSTLAVDSRIVLPSALTEAEDIEAANGYIWSITSTSPANLVRVNPATMAYTTFNLNFGGYRLDYGESLDYSFGKLWAGGQNRIAEIDISNPSSPTFVTHSYSSLVQTYYILGTALSNDGTYLWALFLQATPPPTIEFISSTLVRINPANPTVGFVYENLSSLFPDDMVNLGGYLFTSSEDDGQPSDAYRFPVSVVPYTTAAMSSTKSYGVFNTPTDPQSLWGAYVGAPGIITKFDTNLNQLHTFLLPTNYDDPAEVVFDGSGNMYVATFQAPAGIVKYTVPDAVNLSITKSASNVVLGWTNSDAYVDHYEVWRSPNPYFSPGDAGSTKLIDVTATMGAMSYTDNNVLGNVDINHFYIVRAVNDFGLLAPISNRVGEFEFTLYETPTTDFTWIAVTLSNPNIIMASNLANHIEANSNGSVSVQTIRRWNPIAQSYGIYYHQFQFGDFPVQSQYPYLIEVDIPAVTSGTVIWPSLGNVPAIGSYSYTLYDTAQTDYTWVMQPLDYASVTLASALALNIEANASPAVTVQTVRRWNAPAQSSGIYYHQFAFGDFPTRVGYPYQIEANVSSGSTAVWP